MKEPITPGEILLEEYLKPMGISQNAMARAIGVSPRAINEIVLGRRSITPPMSIRFGAFFGQSDKFWHSIQVECDFRKLAGDRIRLIIGIQPATTVAARNGGRLGARPVPHCHDPQGGGTLDGRSDNHNRSPKEGMNENGQVPLPVRLGNAQWRNPEG